MFCEVSEIQFASKVTKFSFVSLRIFRILQLAILKHLNCRQVYERDVGCFSSQKKITYDHKTGAMDDEQDAAGASFVRRLTGQESVRSTSGRKVALHL